MFDRMKKSRRQLGNLLKELADEYEFVVLDCPPNITLLSENVFRAADWILVPVIPTTLSLRTLEQLFRFFRKKDLPVESLLPFFSMVQARNRMHRDLMDDTRRQYPWFLESVIPFTVEVERMGEHRKPVIDYAPNGKAGVAYKALCNDIMVRIAP
jgi:chromosome partitioning protein